MEPFKVDFEKLQDEKRAIVNITVAKSLKKYLRDLYNELDIEGYTFSYLIEDIIYWVVSDRQRLMAFIRDAYEEAIEEKIPERSILEFVGEDYGKEEIQEEDQKKNRS